MPWFHFRSDRGCIIGALVLTTLFASCAPRTSTVASRPLPADESVRSAIAAIARAQAEIGTSAFVEDRRQPAVLTARSRQGDAPDLAAIGARGEIVVAMLGEDNPPFFWHERTGRLAGLDVVLARDIARQLGVRVRFNTAARTFDDVVSFVRDRRADVGISKLSVTLGRARSVAFSQPYVDLHRALLANRLALTRLAADRPLVPVVQHFAGRLGVIAHSSYAVYAREAFPHATLVPYRTWDDEVRAVRAGTVTAGFRDELEVTRLVDGDPSAGLVMRPIVFSDASDAIAIAVPWGDPQLRSYIDVFLANRGLVNLPAAAVLYAFPPATRA